MHTILSRAFALTLLAGLVFTPLAAASTAVGQAVVADAPARPLPLPAAAEPAGLAPERFPTTADPAAPALQGAIPVFRFPVVPGATTGGYFDHNRTGGMVMFYDGRYNAPGAGFYFRCLDPQMNDWVGCQDAVSGEPACSNNRELWYDNHKGIDYEFSPNWQSGATCIPREQRTDTMPIYSPARGWVQFAGEDLSRPANGHFILLKHDLNGNGNFNDDNLRSYYLHFTAYRLAVSTGQIAQEGQYLGLGGSTGLSSTGHLHFEVQRSADNFISTSWSVDPYGWQGAGNDPWPYLNVRLFRDPVNYSEAVYIPLALNAFPPCTNCSELLSNGGFESGRTIWVEQGSQLIANTSETNLNVSPHQGSWLGWLGGINTTADALYQNFQVPQGVQQAVLTYYLNVASTDAGGVKDVMVVNLRNTSGDLVRQLDYTDNTFSPGNSWVRRSITINNLAGWQGQTLRLSFESTNNATYQTSFYIDTIALLVTGP